MWALQLLLFAVLLVMALQDFKHRAIYAWLFLVLFGVLGTMKAMGGSWIAMAKDLGYNAAFLGLQILLISIYFSLKERKWVNIFSTYFGLGDLLFLFSLTAYLSFLNYVFFYIISLICCILASLIISVFSKGFKRMIPLAGMQAVVFALWVGLSFLDQKIILTSDLELINFFGL